MTAPVFSLPDGRSGGDVRSPKTAELLTRRLRRMIVNGDLCDGDYLPREAELMTHFGVSRPTLREAVRVLEAERLVEVRRGSRTGARVRVPGPETVARPAGLLLQVAGSTVGEVLTARLGIEPLAAWLVTERGSTESLGALTEVLVQLKAEVAEVDIPPAAGLARFHEVVIEQSGNRALFIMSGMLREIIARHLSTLTRIKHDIDPEDARHQCRRAVRAYEKLVELVRAGDANKAEQFWRHHIEVANETLLQGVDSDALIDYME